MPSLPLGPFGIALLVLAAVALAAVALAPAGPARRRRLRRVGRLALAVAVAVAALLLVERYVVTPFTVPSESMADTFARGDRLLAARFTTRLGDPGRGDVVVFHPNGRDDRAFFAPTVSDLTDVARVVGLPGEWIRARSGRVQACRDAAGLRCRAVREPYVSSRQADFGPIEVPRGRFFLLGDDRAASRDSRVWGAVRASQIVGRGFMVYWPLTRIRFF